MSNERFRVEGIGQAELDPKGDRVFLQMSSAAGGLELETPLDLLPRLVGLCLHVIGRAELCGRPETAALLPEGLAIYGFPDGHVGLRFLLPGGAPLTFLLDASDAKSLGIGLVDHVKSQSRRGGLN